MNYLQKNAGFISKVILLIICLLLFLPNMGDYPFIDTDETKFVSIAKDMLHNSDWINIKLNNQNLFNINPFTIWIINLSCLIFGKISLEAVRLPISIISIFGIFSIFVILKGILRKTYSFLIATIMATCLGTLIFSRIATNYMIYTVFNMLYVLFSYRIIFKSKTKYWAGLYTFSTLAFLTGGLFGLVIPLLSTIAMHIFAGKIKDVFKLKNIIVGILIITILALPWYGIMIHKHGFEFVKEYLTAYNIIKFAGLKETFSVICMFILGFLPWSFSFLWIIIQRFKDIYNSVISYFKENSQAKLKEKWEKLQLIDKFLSINAIVFCVAGLFAILYGSKYTFLVLFMMFPASCIAGNYWYEYIIKKEHDKSIFFATMVPNLIFITCSFIGLFGHNIVNQWLFHSLKHIIVPLVIIFFVIPIISIFAVILKGRVTPFISNLVLMLSLSFVITSNIFNFITINGGENDLIKFANIAKKDNAVLTAYIPSRKHSLVYYYDKPVEFLNSKNIDELKKYLNKNPEAYIVVEIKEMSNVERNEIKFIIIDAGKRYCLIQKMPEHIEKIESEKEPEIFVY